MPLANRFIPFGTTIFAEMSALALKHNAVNLAQGFPDFDGPAFIKQAAREAMDAGHNQYARMSGIPPLNQAIAQAWAASTGQQIDPDSQVTVTSGCTEAIAASMLGLVNPGEEVILFEPYYDSYRAAVAMAGGVPKFVTLRAPRLEHGGSGGAGGFWFDPAELRAAFTPKTKLILVNTPHNPTGKVFSRAELEQIAALCLEHDILALTDEVYEYLTFDPAQPHVRLATLPGMQERTLTCSSLGKSFSLTGWKIGWTVGPAELNRAVRSAHQFLTFATAAPLQHGAAAAAGMNAQATAAVRDLVDQLAAGREYLASAIERLGFTVYRPAGTYFLMVDWASATIGGTRLGERFPDDAAFCRHLTIAAGVAAIPPSVFYEHKEHGRSLARFAFCKKPATLEEAVARLERWHASPKL